MLENFDGVPMGVPICPAPIWPQPQNMNLDSISMAQCIFDSKIVGSLLGNHLPPMAQAHGARPCRETGMCLEQRPEPQKRNSGSISMAQ